jgi:hypothetical protein
MENSSVGSKTERQTIERIGRKLKRLRRVLAQPPPSDRAQARQMFLHLAKIKEIQGNLHNDISALSCLLAGCYLSKRHTLGDTNFLAKHQNTAGPDMDDRTSGGKRVVGEIKTMIPLYHGEFGEAQHEAILEDLAKLRSCRAHHKYFFVTSSAAYKAMRDPFYHRYLKGFKLIRLV